MEKNENKNPEAAEAPQVQEAAEAQKEERVELFVPKGYAGEEPNLFISVNGVNFLLPRGKRSTVPAFVAAEYERSVKAQEALDNHIEEMLQASK